MNKILIITAMMMTVICAPTEGCTWKHCRYGCKMMGYDGRAEEKVNSGRWGHHVDDRCWCYKGKWSNIVASNLRCLKKDDWDALKANGTIDKVKKGYPNSSDYKDRKSYYDDVALYDQVYL